MLVGNDKLMTSNDINFEKCDDFGTIVYVAKNNIFLGTIVINDRIKETSKESLAALKNIGIQK